MKKISTVILGAGVSGLSAGYTSGLPIYEAQSFPGGICSSYYIKPGTKRRLESMPGNEEAYRFEVGGGHWIFGADKEAENFIKKFVLPKIYNRLAAVYFTDKNLYVPYPLQNNLHFFEDTLITKILNEISGCPPRKTRTMQDWLRKHFGHTLCKLFFYPFNDSYTAGLYRKIAPQDSYKSPIDIRQVRQGAEKNVKPVGYNVTFIYPEEGLDVFCKRLAGQCDIEYGKKVITIDRIRKKIYFSDTSSVFYKKIISTLPLRTMLEITNLKTKELADPYTSVLVLNVGAVRGRHCPNEHWLYIPDSMSGFHRVGFYSNVDVPFLPKAFRKNESRVSIYIERAYPAGEKPSALTIKKYISSVVKELQVWGFIGKVEAADTTWIDVAYTWVWPNSQWREEAIGLLKMNDIYQLGRYGRWRFQGIAESIEEGLAVGLRYRTKAEKE